MGAFHFAEPLWLWLLLLPLPIAAFYRLVRPQAAASGHISAFADAHLLPHLLRVSGEAERVAAPRLLVWALMWSLGVLALAGPRWNYHDVTLYQRDAALVILLDLSASMRAADVPPSRMERARQEIEDILRANRDRHLGLQIGIVGFAAMAHVLAPVTEDMETLLELLPDMDTSLIQRQGSRPAEAVKLAEQLLEFYGSESRHALLVTDGDLEESDADALRTALERAKMPLAILTVGGAEGAPIPDVKGGWILDGQGNAVISKLQPEVIRALVAAGGGKWTAANFLGEDTAEVLAPLTQRGSDVKDDIERRQRVWEERYDLFLWPLLVMLLPVFRRQRKEKEEETVFRTTARVAALAVWMGVVWTALCWPYPAHAADGMLSERAGVAAFEAENYDKAAELLHDPYRQGVAYYRAGDYARAAAAFARSGREAMAADSQYNLGNARFMQQDYAGAIAAYERTLNMRSDHADAKHNLELAKDMQQRRQRQESPQRNQPAIPQPKPPHSPELPTPPAASGDPTPSAVDMAADHVFNQLDSDPSELMRRQVQQEERGKTQRGEKTGDNASIRPW